MDTKGVITGDIIQSTAIQTELRPVLLNTIRDLACELKYISPLKIELFRGDSFQLLVENPEKALKIAILLRAGLQWNTPVNSKGKWDARIAVGIGQAEYTSESVILSDGEAFHNSGWEFDELGKRKLSIRTPWDEVNNELRVSTAFVDDIISVWSTTQAQAIYLSLLYRKPQKEIAIQLERTAQNISKLLNVGKESLIKMYLDRYEQLITKELSWK